MVNKIFLFMHKENIMNLSDNSKINTFFPVILVIETSGGMAGINIAAVNAAINNAISEIRDMQINEYPDKKILFNILEYSTGTRWHTPQLIDASDFKFNNLEAEGFANLGAACGVLNEELSNIELINNPHDRYAAPIILLAAYRQPTDDFYKAIKTLKENSRFKSSLKIAVIIGSDVEKNDLIEFTGTNEAISIIENILDFEKRFCFLLITSIRTVLDTDCLIDNKQNKNNNV